MGGAFEFVQQETSRGHVSVHGRQQKHSRSAFQRFMKITPTNLSTMFNVRLTLKVLHIQVIKGDVTDYHYTPD